MPKITITIPRSGDVTIAVNGVKGPGCKKLTQRFEEVLGNVTSSEATSEMYEQEEVQSETQY